VFLIACTPAAPPAESAAPARTAAPSAQARTNVDVRLELVEGPDPDYGEGATSVRGVLVISALSMNRKLFAVPSPYTCRRGTSSADELVVECSGEDGVAYARLRTEAGHVVVVARDYGRLESRRTEEAIALPANATATLFAPLKYPGPR
jgi:hypothetical protein